MRMIMLCFLILLAAALCASAVEVALVVEFPDGTLETECLDVPDNSNGYETLEASLFDLTWSGAGIYGHALCKINNIGDDLRGNSCAFGSESWGFFSDLDDNGRWAFSSVGFDAPGGCAFHYCADEGDVLGFVRTGFDESFNAINQPAYRSFTQVCSKLVISNIDVEVDGKSDRHISDGQTIRKKANPGSVVEFDVEVSNLYTRNVDIEDVEITVTIEKIDDGEEIDDESDDFDLRPGEDEKESIELRVPWLVDEDRYTVVIEAEGKDTNGKILEARQTIYLIVDKEKDDVVIHDFSIGSGALQCLRSTTLDIEVMNLGSKDEDDIKLAISSDELGIDIIKNGIELDEGDDRDSVFDELYTIEVDGSVEEGSYEIWARVYTDGRLSDQESVSVYVRDCNGAGISGDKEGSREKKDTAMPTGAVVISGAATTEIEDGQGKQENFLERNWLTFLVVLINLVIIVLGIAIVSIVVRRD